MSPLTRVLQKYAEEIECNGITPPLYYIDGTWYGLSPYPIVKETPPRELEVEEETKLEFKTIEQLGSSGLYTNQEVAAVQNVLTFGMQRAAVTNLIARKISGSETDNQGYTSTRLFDTMEMKTLAYSTMSHIWGWFTDIGLIMSTFIGFYVIFKTIKYVIGVILNGMALYETLGCGVTILASFWNSLSWLLLHKHRKYKTSPDVHDIEMQHVSTTDTYQPKNKEDEVRPSVHWTEK